MNYLKIKNWENFQHYKKRSPPWIKLHRDLLNDYEFSCLQDASKLQLMLIWLLASQMNNKIPADPDFIKRRLNLKNTINLKELIDKGFIIDDSNVLATRKQVAMPERERERERETETEKKSKPKKEKISLDELSVEHIQDWLNQKRALGKFLTIDEYELLETFKDYCLSKTPNYKDYVAAFRNSFKWENAPTKGNGNENRYKTSSEKADDVLERRLADIRRRKAESDKSNGQRHLQDIG